SSGAAMDGLAARGALRLTEAAEVPGTVFAVVEIPSPLSQRTAEFDALLLAELAAEDYAGRRWLRLSPRYMSPSLRRFRSVECDAATFSRLVDRIGQLAAGHKE
ncbi:MAG: hypothetical protein WCE75_13905, partial [Terracidiphilus sp.]